MQNSVFLVVGRENAAPCTAKKSAARGGLHLLPPFCTLLISIVSGSNKISFYNLMGQKDPMNFDGFDEFK